MKRLAYIALLAVAIAAGLFGGSVRSVTARDAPPAEPALDVNGVPFGCAAAASAGEPWPGATCPDGWIIGVDGTPHTPASIPAGCTGSTASTAVAAPAGTICPNGSVIGTDGIPYDEFAFPAGCYGSLSDRFKQSDEPCPDGSHETNTGLAGCLQVGTGQKWPGAPRPGTLCSDTQVLGPAPDFVQFDRVDLPPGCRGATNVVPVYQPGAVCPDGTVVGDDGQWRYAAVEPSPPITQPDPATIPPGCARSTSPGTPMPGTLCPDGTVVGSLGEDDVESAAGSGIDALIPTGDFHGGDAKTLAETYPLGAYTWSKDYGWKDAWRNPLHEAANGLLQQSFLFGWLGMWAFQMTLKINPGTFLAGAWLGDLTERLTAAILVPFLALAGAATGVRGIIAIARRQTARAFGIVGCSVLAVATTLALLGAPEQVMMTGHDASSELINQISGIGCNPPDTCDQVNPEQAAMFPDVRPTFTSESALRNTSRRAVDRFFYSTVVVPWAMGEFGSIQNAGNATDGGRGWAQEYLDARVRGGSTSDVLDDWKDEHSAQKNWANGKNHWQRFVIAGMALLTNIFLCVILLGAAGTILMAYLGLLYLFVIGAFAGATATLSDRGFQLWKRWLGYIATQFVKRVLIVAFVILMVEILAAIVAQLGQTNYLLVMLWMFVTMFAGLHWRRVFIAMFTQLIMPGARPAGGGAVAPALAAGASYGLLQRAGGLGGARGRAPAGAGVAGGSPGPGAGTLGRARVANPYLLAAGAAAAGLGKAKASLQVSAAPLMLDGQSTRTGSTGAVGGILIGAAFAKPGFTTPKPTAKPVPPPPPAKATPTPPGMPGLPAGPRPAGALPAGPHRPALPPPDRTGAGPAQPGVAHDRADPPTRITAAPAHRPVAGDRRHPHRARDRPRQDRTEPPRRVREPRVP